MFSRKLDKLYVRNDLCPIFRRLDAVDVLVQQLPLLGKKVWCAITCTIPINHGIPQNVVTNEHTITGMSTLLAPIEALPHDLFCMVADYVPELIRDIRLASRPLRIRVDEYCLQPSSLILVKELTILDYVGLRMGKVFDLKLEVRTKMSKLFELRLKLQLPIINSYTLFECSRAEHASRSYHVVFDECLLGVVQASMGRRVGKIKKGESLNSYNPYVRISEALGSNQLQFLKVDAHTLNNSDMTEIMNIVKQHKVDKLALRAYQVRISDHVDFWRELSALVRSLYVDQFFREYDLNVAPSQYFFDARGTDWAPVIMDMFSRKLDKLYIRNDRRPIFGWQHTADVLTQQLFLLGKKVWCAISCRIPPHHGIPRNSVVNGHTITVQKRFRRTFNVETLTIKHASRLSEKYYV